MKTKKLLLGAIAVALIVGSIIVYLMWPIGIDVVAEKTLAAARTGDGATLYRFSFESEVEAAGLTPELLSAIWRVSVLPRLDGYREASAPTVEVNADGSQAIARVVLRDSEGHDLELLSAPLIADEGPRISPMNFVTAMWTQEYVVERGKTVSPLSILEARIEGLKNDRPGLEAVGLKGLPSRRDDGSFFTWDEALASWQKTLDSMQASSQ